MMNRLEKELEVFVKSKHQGHDETMKSFEKWGSDLEGIMGKIENVNSTFFKQISGKMGEVERWFAKKEKQFDRFFRNFH
jgi:uncharacterized protein (UPF0128 family)